MYITYVNVFSKVFCYQMLNLNIYIQISIGVGFGYHSSLYKHREFYYMLRLMYLLKMSINCSECTIIRYCIDTGSCYIRTFLWLKIILNKFILCSHFSSLHFINVFFIIERKELFYR